MCICFIHGVEVNSRFLIFLTEEDYPAPIEHPADAEPTAALVTVLQAIAGGVPGHDHGGNLVEAMQASSPVRPYVVPLTPDAQGGAATVRLLAQVLASEMAGWLDAQVRKRPELASRCKESKP